MSVVSGPEGVERRFAAPLKLFGHVFLDHVHGHVARTFVHHLHAFGPCAFGQFTLHFEFAELRLVVGVRDAAGMLSAIIRFNLGKMFQIRLA